MKHDQDISRYIKIQAPIRSHISRQNVNSSKCLNTYGASLPRLLQKVFSPSLSLSLSLHFPFSSFFLLYQHKFLAISDDASGLYVLYVLFRFALAMSWSVLICMSAQKPALLPFCTVSCSQTSCEIATLSEHICGPSVEPETEDITLLPEGLTRIICGITWE